MLTLARGAFSVPLLMSMLETFSVSLLTLIKLYYTKALEWSRLVPGSEAKSSSSEITKSNIVHFKISVVFPLLRSKKIDGSWSEHRVASCPKVPHMGIYLFIFLVSSLMNLQLSLRKTGIVVLPLVASGFCSIMEMIWWLESSFCSTAEAAAAFSLIYYRKKVFSGFYFSPNILGRTVLSLWRKYWEFVGTSLFAMILSHSILTVPHTDFSSLVKQFSLASWGEGCPIFLPWSHPGK